MDRVQIQQVVVNLVRNAVEAVLDAPRREVAVATAVLGTGMVEVSVADTGPGLAEEVAGRLFEPFVTGRSDGTGLGLAIVSKIALAHRGQARLLERDGATTFLLDLPWQPS